MTQFEQNEILVPRALNIRSEIKSIKVGEEKSFPIDRLKSVRSQASELGAILNCRYVTRTDRLARTIIVKRVC